MVEHRFVVLAPDAGLLIAAKGRVSGIGVIAIGPDAARLYRAAEAVAAVHVAAPHARAKAIERVVGDFERVVVVLEGRDGDDGAKNFLLEHAHLVVALEQGRLNVVAAFECAAQMRLLAADQDLCAFFLADRQVRKNLGQLFLGRLRAEHGVDIERVALLDRGHAF